MKSTTSINLNLQLPNYSVAVYAVQGDTMSREIEAALFDGQTPFTPPAGALGTVRYYKPDGTSGFYDTLEDEETVAVTWDDNVATIRLAEQTVTVPGEVLVQLSFYSADAERLSAFTFRLFVEKNPYSDQEFESTDYYSVLTARIAAVLNVTTHAPSINNLGHWVLWNDETQQYYDSGVDATGPQGPQGEEGPQGPAGRDGEGAPGSDLPLMDGTPSAGSHIAYSREDHVHPTDTNLKSELSADIIKNASIAPYKIKKYIIIGDSYMAIGTGLGVQIVGITGIDAISFAAGGGGFVGQGGQYTFLTGLQQVAAGMVSTQKDAITDIYVLGGWNDYNFPSADIMTAMTTFDTYVKTTFQNAHITLGVVGYSKRSTDLALIENNVITTYAYQASTLGWSYIPHANSAIHYPDAISSDGVHPTTTEDIAKYVAMYITGKTPYWNSRLVNTMSAYNNTISSGIMTLHSQIVDGVCTVQNKTAAGFVFTSPFGFSGDLDPTNRTPIGTYGGFLQGIEYQGTPTAFATIPVNGVWINNASFEDCDGILWIAYGYIYLSIKRKYGMPQGSFTSSSFTIPPFSITVPSDLC